MTITAMIIALIFTAPMAYLTYILLKARMELRLFRLRRQISDECAQLCVDLNNLNTQGRLTHEAYSTLYSSALQVLMKAPTINGKGWQHTHRHLAGQVQDLREQMKSWTGPEITMML